MAVPFCDIMKQSNWFFPGFSLTLFVFDLESDTSGRMWKEYLDVPSPSREGYRAHLPKYVSKILAPFVACFVLIALGR